MIYGLLKGGRKDEAKNLFYSISANDLVPDKVSYRIMILSHIEEGLLQEADDLFMSMDKNGCSSDSRMLNAIVRRLLQKGEVIRAVPYLSKLDENNFSLRASTSELLTSLFSREKYQYHVKLLPEKYQCLAESRDD